MQRHLEIIEFHEQGTVPVPINLFDRLATGQTKQGDWLKLFDILETAKENGLDVG